jgi:hypothetical protein
MTTSVVSAATLCRSDLDMGFVLGGGGSGSDHAGHKTGVLGAAAISAQRRSTTNSFGFAVFPATPAAPEHLGIVQFGSVVARVEIPARTGLFGLRSRQGPSLQPLPARLRDHALELGKERRRVGIVQRRATADAHQPNLDQVEQ